MVRSSSTSVPLSDILKQCAKEKVDPNLTELVEKVLRSCWENKKKRCRAHQLAAIIQEGLHL